MQCNQNMLFKRAPPVPRLVVRAMVHFSVLSYILFLERSTAAKVLMLYYTSILTCSSDASLPT
jgi:hypothetical protein